MSCAGNNGDGCGRGFRGRWGRIVGLSLVISLASGYCQGQATSVPASSPTTAPVTAPASAPANAIPELQAKVKQAESALQAIRDNRLKSLEDAPSYRQAKAALEAAEAKAAELRPLGVDVQKKLDAANAIGKIRKEMAEIESQWLFQEPKYVAARSAAEAAQGELLREQKRVREINRVRATQEAATHAAALAALRTAYYPSGKVRATCEVNARGERHGLCRVFDEGGKLIGEEEWFHDRLVLPKTPNFIEAARKQIVLDAAEAVRAFGASSNPAAPPADQLARALAKVRTYRFLCDVPYRDVTYDDTYIDLCQHAAQLLSKIGHLDHTPARPAGVDEAFYKLAYKGTSQSNLSEGTPVGDTPDSYMNDSDPGNIDRVGHRRWVLNPRMLKTGFGGSGRFSAMYSFDGGRKDAPDYNFVCYPPVGACPRDLFSAGYAWHISFNPAHYAMVDESVKMNIYLLDANLKRAATPLELNYSHVDTGGFGIPGAVIVRPAGFSLRTDTAYEVVVTGLKPRQNNRPAEISYLVRFY